MSCSSSQTAQTTYHYAPLGVASKIRAFFKGMVRFEPAAVAIQAENARIRDTGRNWLM